MHQQIEPLILDFVAWIAVAPRPYREAIEAWRTSCPRLTVWEEAMERGLVRREAGEGGAVVTVTPAGRRLLTENGRSSLPMAPMPALPGAPSS